MTELQEQIIELRKQNVGMKAIAKMLNCNLWTVRQTSKRYGLDGYRVPWLLLEDEVKSRIEKMLLDFEYVGGWESVDKYVYLQCKWCGYTLKRSAQFLKPNHWHNVKCPLCDANARRITKNLLKQERERERQKLREQRELKKWNRPFSQLTMRECKCCKQLFVPQTPKAKYCSPKCAESFDMSRHSSKRDAYRYILPIEVLYKRDNGICHLCGGKCDFNDYIEKDGAFIAGPTYPSRDHVVPKSKGGKHTWSNIRLAHFYCNTLRGAKDL